jgi:hypothetical protein
LKKKKRRATVHPRLRQIFNNRGQKRTHETPFAFRKRLRPVWKEKNDRGGFWVLVIEL